MPATTPDGLRYPLSSDIPNVPRDISNLATDTQAALARVSSLTVRSIIVASGTYEATPPSAQWSHYALQTLNHTAGSGLSLSNGAITAAVTGLYRLNGIVMYYGAVNVAQSWTFVASISAGATLKPAFFVYSAVDQTRMEAGYVVNLGVPNVGQSEYYRASLGVTNRMEYTLSVERITN